MGRTVNVVAPPIRGSGPNDWHVEKGIMQPGLDSQTEQKVLSRRLARAGVHPGLIDEPPSKTELREKAKALTLAEQELAKARAALEAEREAFEAEKEARASARDAK